MKRLEKEVFHANDALGVEKDGWKLKDLEFFKGQEIPGPFTTSEEEGKYQETAVNEKGNKTGCMLMWGRYTTKDIRFVHGYYFSDFYR